MLLEFELENDGAFAASNRISLLASSLKEDLRQCVVDAGDVGHSQVLTSALVLGKNGSGKSTLVGAMKFVANFVKNSARESQVGDEIPYEPNRLISECENKPTRYRVAFSMNGTIYDFEFSHDKIRVIYEHLQVSDRSVRFRRMYERRWKDEEQRFTYKWGEALGGRKSIWEESTRDNALFLSTAAQLNSDDVRPAFEWLSNYCRSKDIKGGGNGGFTARECLNDASLTEKVAKFLRALDINVERIEIEEEELEENFIIKTFSNEMIDLFNKASIDTKSRTTRLKVFFWKRKKDGGLSKFSLSSESTGTQALFHLAGPLFDTLKNGYCLLIDEINTSLHPVVVSFLVDMFSDKRQNCRRAQLIFTSHDTAILAQHHMRRDQIWIIDSDGEAASLIPLSDFSPRRREALDKGYLGGRYGGIPNVSPALLPATDCD